MALLDTATAWWSAGDVVSGDLNDKIGTHDMADNGTVQHLDDGTYHYAELRVASSDYFDTADHADFDSGSGDFTCVAVITPQVNLTGSKIIISKRDSNGIGWNIFSNGAVLSGSIDITAGAPGAVTATGGNLAVGTRATIASVRSSGTNRVVLDGTAGSGASNAGSIDNSVTFRIGRGSGGTTLYSDIDFYGMAWFKGTALSDADTVTVGNELLAAALLVTGSTTKSLSALGVG